MKIPLSWIKDFVDIDLPLAELAHRMTLADLEVEEIRVVGWMIPTGDHQEYKISGIAWEPDKIIVAAVHEVTPHPNADRLVLCRLDDGQRENIVLTGAPNLYPYKGLGALDKPLKVAYAREGARIYDGHQPGQVLTTLKRAKIRGVEFLLDDLLGERARHFRGSRRRHHPGRGRPRGRTAGGIYGRRRV